MIMLSLFAGALDLKGVFSKGEFQCDEKDIYVKVPDRFEKYYPKNVCLKLFAPLHSLKNAAIAFWKKLLKVMKIIDYKKSNANPCLYTMLTVMSKIIWLSWIYDYMYYSKREEVEKSRDKVINKIGCEDTGELKECIGCKIEKNDDAIKLLQSVFT